MELTEPIPYTVVFPDGSTVDFNPGEAIVVRALRSVLVRPRS